jgi:hypothetical protein
MERKEINVCLIMQSLKMLNEFFIIMLQVLKNNDGEEKNDPV